jgi:Cys-rich four helix bundle protein (predicted Tat secretion target)
MRSSGLRSEKGEKTREIESARLGESPRFFKLLTENHRSRANDIAERESIMQPHDFLTVSGTAVAVAVVTSSQALAELSVEPMHPTRFKDVQEAAGHCVETGKDCLRHCFGMLSMGDSRMAGCTAAAYQLIAACSALQSLAAVNSAHAAHFGRVVTKICLDCEKECKKFTDIAECVACSDTCKACAEECHKAWIYVLRTP